MKLNKNKKEVKAARLFEDRTEFRKAFWNKYNWMKDHIDSLDDVYILNYYGLGGIGKSGLIRKLEKELIENENPSYYLFYDFQAGQDVYSILKVFRNYLIEKYQFEFPKFDIALICYAKKVGERIDKEEIKSVVESSRTLSLLLDASEFIPQLSIAASLFKLADSGIAWIRNLTDKRYKAELSKLENMSAEEILKKLPEYFAKDMTNNMDALDRPFVVFLDTFEKMVDRIGNEGKAEIKDLWLRGADGLVLNIPNVLWVISGREKLSWSQYDSDWEDSIESHLLKDLAFADADDFLRNAGFEENQLREELIQLTNGTPVYLDICVSTLETLLQNEQEVTLDKFGKNTEQLLERFIRYMDSQSREMAHLFCLLDVWSDKMILDIGAKIIPSFSAIIYDSLKSASFVTKKGEIYYVHKTVRDTMNQVCPSIIKQKYYEVMYVYLYQYLVKSTNVLNEYYSSYLKMYANIVNDTLNQENADQCILDYMRIYHTVKASGNSTMAKQFFYQGMERFNIRCRNSYIWLIEWAVLLTDANDIYSSVFLCMEALSSILDHSVCDIYGIYKILEIRKNTIHFLPRKLILNLLDYVSQLDLSKDLLLDEKQMIYGKSPEFYRYKVLENICDMVDQTNHDNIVLFLENIDRIKNGVEKTEITIDLMKKLKDECCYYDYQKMSECLLFCEDFLNDEQNYSGLLERKVACVLADLAQIYSTEQFYNQEKSLNFITKAKQAALDYYNNDFAVYVYVMGKKIDILLQKDKKQAAVTAAQTMDYINKNYTKEEIKPYIFSSEFTSIAKALSDADCDNSHIARQEYDRVIKQSRFLVGVLNSELNNLYRVLKESYPECVAGIDPDDFKDFKAISLKLRETAKDDSDYDDRMIHVYEILHHYFIHEVKLSGQKLLMFLESLAASVQFFGGDSLKYRLEYIEASKNIYGEYDYNTLDGYEMLAQYDLENKFYEAYKDVCREIMKCCRKAGMDIDLYMHAFEESIADSEETEQVIYLYEQHIAQYKEYYEENKPQYLLILEKISDLKIHSGHPSLIQSGILDKISILDELKKRLPENHLKLLREELTIASACLEAGMMEEAAAFNQEAQKKLSNIKENIDTAKYMHFVNAVLIIYMRCGLADEAKDVAAELKFLLERENNPSLYQEMIENCKKAG